MYDLIRPATSADAAGIYARAVAEHVFAFILCRQKNILALDGAMKSGKYTAD
jgi:phosphoglycerate dehydrogenase-like enzyme